MYSNQVYQLSRPTIAHFLHNWNYVFNGESFRRMLIEAETVYEWNQKMSEDFLKKASFSNTSHIQNCLVALQQKISIFFNSAYVLTQ